MANRSSQVALRRPIRAAYAEDRGQGTVEYVLVLGVIVVGIFTAVNWAGLGPEIQAALGAVVSLFDGTTTIF